MKPLSTRLLNALLKRIAGTITHVVTDEAVVALTFDDGPDPVFTPDILKILAAHGARATFFMCGERAAAYPELVAEVRAAGHAIGNHSWDHPSFPLIPRRERILQLRHCAKVLQGANSCLFRPPYGHQTAASRVDVWLTGHQVVMWNVEVPDWEDHDGQWLANRAMQQVSAGSIILMHDGLYDVMHDRQFDRGPTLGAVETILTQLGSRYDFVTLPELLQRGTPVRVNWLMKPDIGFLNRLVRKAGPARRYDVSKEKKPWLAYNR